MPRPNLRKRPHSEAFTPEADQPDQDDTPPAPGSSGDAKESDESKTREQEIWEAFKEDYHETVEQLPLYLYRSYSLMRELDQNAQQYQTLLLQLMRKYIALRQSQTSAADALANPNPDDQSASLEGSVLRSSSVPTPANQSSRKLLSSIARLATAWLQATDEKLSISRAAYSSVDRHVRALDLEMPEQSSNDSAISKPASAQQGEPSLSSNAQNVKEGSSPVSATLQLEATPTPSEQPGSKVSRKTRGRPAGSRNRKLASSSASKPASGTEQTSVDPTPSTSGPVLDMDVVPHEPRYCFCQRVSFGEMVACDYPKCEKEWFHYECVGLTEAPKGKWICPDCTEVAAQARKRR
ncbi:hypothetical protein SISNIDRAFT_546111 [Sistotremastrum niveocremeum HHB9708]|uniref:Chromatin modification-related protein n=2 Tax=Sistotremastraceae TaxID=3402574 RepID=A0A165AN34_9AGAM|nr:hypothetical protein SISNIDRAFT_546111 [Sistotremastrum niveocremeum HHB9708]KZT36985.1 hypothetical protein SISSUDRAFT_1129968 [Sistotremastrum suecicum HHB10207 ss-3]